MLGGYGDFLYQTGMIDDLQRQYVITQTDLGVTLIQQQKWLEAFRVGDIYRLFFPISVYVAVFHFLDILLQVFDGLLNGDLDPYPSFFQNATGCTNYFNYMQCQVIMAFRTS